MGKDGEPKPIGEIAAGDRTKQSTGPGEVWLISDLSDQPLGHFVVDDRTARAMIEAE